MALITKKSGSVRPKLVQVAQTREGTTESFDGTRLWYRSVGEGLPIICCNGLGCSTFYFSYLEDYFKRNYQVITWDYRGHGKSEAPKIRKNHTIESLAKDLVCIMNTLGIDQAIIVGHSMGTQVLYEFQARHAEKCLALIPCFGTFEKPIDTFLDSPISKYAFEVIYIFNHLFPKISHLIGKLLIKNPFWFQVAGILKMLQPYLADKRILRQYMEHFVNVDPIFLSKLTRSMQQHTAESSLKKIKVPTLIFGGEEDVFTPVWLSKKMHHLIPDSELFIIKKGSHVALVEQPELMNFRIEKFIQERVLPKKTTSKPKLKIVNTLKKNSK
jgi:pimeloyl-ACP methyl ester carboxylesterase